MAPPSEDGRHSRLEADGDTSDRDEATLERKQVSTSLSADTRGIRTDVTVVLAAHSAGRARVAAADTDDGDGRAGQANRDVEVLEDDTEKAQDRGGGGVASLYDNDIS